MRCPALLLPVAALLAVAPRPASAGEDLVQRALRQNLAREGAGRDLPQVLAELERRDEAQRAEFAAVAATPLPAKAAARLAATRAAYEEGQGRLLALLRELARADRAEDAAARASRLEEAAALAAHLELAARPEPVSGALRVRAPAVSPPALPATAPGRGPASAQAPVSAAPIGDVNPLLQSVADDLGGALEIFSFVRNNVAAELYHGVLKGPVQTYLERSGNDTDTAGLLVALLRARGIPARFVLGTAEVPIESLRRLVGSAGSVEDALRVLERAGVPHEPVLGPGGVSSVKLARVWVEAYVPYANYRGLELDSQGKGWLPLDPAYKLLEPAAGLDVVAELGLDPLAAWDEYLSAPRTQTPREFLRARVESLLAAQRPGTTYESVLNRRGLVPETLGLLPNTLPYQAVAAEAAYELPEALAHQVRLVGTLGAVTVIDGRFPAAELLGGRVTLSYLPFDDDDAAVLERFGGLYQTPPYLVELKALLNVDGIPQVAGSAPVGLGVKFLLRIEADGPSVHETVENTLLAGNLTALGLGARSVPQQEPEMDAAPKLLARLAFKYLARWSDSDDELARLLRVVPVRPTLSAAFVMSDVDVTYAGGDPLYPLTYEWKGVLVDADFRPMAPVGVERRGQEAPFALWSGLEGSRLEGRVLEDELGVPSIDTVGVIQAAHAQGLAVYDVDRDNVEAVLPGLPFDDTVKGEIREAALVGRTVRVPAAAVTSLEWTGVGYVIRDPESGEAAYQLQGGHSGGVTVAVNGFPAALRDILTLQTSESATCRDARPGSVAQVSQDFQVGTVDKKLESPLRVKVLDVRSRPAKNACVTFSILAGGGKVVDPVTQQEREYVTVRTNDAGEASVGLRLGRKTADNPVFVCEEGRNCSAGGQDEYTQMGLNAVAAQSGTAVLREPFTHLGKPDDGCSAQGQGCTATLTLTTEASAPATNLQVAGLMGVRVEDRHQNPVSNFSVGFAYRPSPEVGTPPPGWTPARQQPTSGPQSGGLVLKPKDYHDCLATRVNPGFNECGTEAAQVEVRSSVNGAYAYAEVGDSPYSLYTFQIGSQQQPGQLKVRYGTWGFLCSSGLDADICAQPTTLVFHGTRPRRVNRRGDFIEAYPAGGTGDVTMWAVSILEDNHVAWNDGAGAYYAYGDNTYRREVLDDSQFAPSPQTPGTTLPGLPSVGSGGAYRGNMGLSSTPQNNVVSFQASHYPREVLYQPGYPKRVVDSTVVGGAYAERQKRPNHPWRGTTSFSLWGARAKIERLDPKSIYVDDQSAALHPTLVRYKVEPEAWRRLLEPWQTQFELKDGAGQTAVGGVANPEAPSQVFTIPRGTRLAPGTFSAELRVIDVNMRRDRIEASPTSVKAGRVNLVLDANNDTKVDERDETLLRERPGATFEFWEADPQRGEKAAEDAPFLHQLEEFAALRLRLPEAPEEPLYLTVQGAGMHLWVARHVGADGACGSRSYLCDRDKANAQFPLLQSLNASRSTDGAARITWELAQGDNDVIFSCGPYLGQGNCQAAGSIRLEREIDGRREPLLERAVRFHDVRKLMSVYSARGPDTSVAPWPMPCDGSVAWVGCAGSNWAPLPARDKAPRVFVFVHGYNVNQADNESKWFPLVFKRFYWAGLPLMEAQEPDPAQRFWMVGFGWLGNQGILGQWGSSAMYIENEMNAMQTGVPLALFVSETLRGRRVVMMAHSLGNMTTSSALSLAPSGSVETFVMNDAAMAAEAFAPPGGYLPVGEEENELGPHTRRYGRPTDRGTDGTLLIPAHDWVGEWQSMVAERNQVSRCNAELPSDYDRWMSRLQGLRQIHPDLDPLPTYDVRWRRHCESSGSCARPSAWGGVYRDVLARGTRVYNTFNPNDYVITLRDVSGTQWWLFAQRFGKPHFGPFGAGADDRCALYWAQLDDMSKAQQDDVWAYGRFSPLNADRSARGLAALTRKWAERTYWFPAISTTAGARDMSPFGIPSYSFETEGLLLHSYLYRERPLSSVWSPYVRIRDLIR